MKKMVMNTNNNLVTLAMIGILVFSCANTNFVVGQCPGMEGIITQCSVYVEKFGPKMDPSPLCCQKIKNGDTSCLCEHFTKALLKFIDMDKVIYVAEMCGKSIPSGTTCGGVTIP